MNEIKFNETMEEIGDFFERRESAIEEAKNNSIENIRSKTENAHGTNLSNLTMLNHWFQATCFST